MRAVRWVLVVALAATLWLGDTPAVEAQGSAVPVLDRPTTTTRAVVLTGRARPRAAVAVQVLTSRWVTVRRVRAASTGRYRVVVPAPVTTRSYRAVSSRRASTVRRVVPPKPVPPPTDECGVRPKRRTGGYYACTLVEEFSGDALDTDRWLGQNMLGRGDRCVAAGPDTVAVAGGSLRLSVVRATDENPCPLRPDGTRGTYAAGWISTHGRWSQQYGRFEARMRVQAADVPGLHEAFWLWPDTRFSSDADWPLSGEIDIAETYSAHPDLVIPFLHYSADSGGPVDGLNTAWSCRTTRGGWHTYALEWTADRLEILVDGRSCLVNTSGASSFRKRFIINLTQLLGAGVNAFDGTAPLPATMEVDWVKAWL
ncbi:MAG TPA: glycoside hydrolase family 16 protein [Nocardioides sp.]|nr:glycoside hydrolase family 16 protein [Nocardioides sp.]